MKMKYPVLSVCSLWPNPFAPIALYNERRNPCQEQDRYVLFLPFWYTKNVCFILLQWFSKSRHLRLTLFPWAQGEATVSSSVGDIHTMICGRWLNTASEMDARSSSTNCPTAPRVWWTWRWLEDAASLYPSCKYFIEVFPKWSQTFTEFSELVKSLKHELGSV